jgi:hypothetical protein
MKFKQYLNDIPLKIEEYLLREETDESFLALEDPKVAKEFEYRFLKLKKAPKETAFIMKILRKHLKTPLKSLSWKSGTQGERNLAVYSESMDAMQFNLSYVKKLNTTGRGKADVNYNEDLQKAKESLSKWQKHQENLSPHMKKDIKKARGAVNRLKVTIRNLEDKINRGETPVPFTSAAYTKNGNEAIEITILHELGHRKQAQNKLDQFKSQVYFNQGQFPSEYSKRNIKEYMSEIYALVKMKLLDKTPISDEAKIYFKGAYNI